MASLQYLNLCLKQALLFPESILRQPAKYVSHFFPIKKIIENELMFFSVYQYILTVSFGLLLL